MPFYGIHWQINECTWIDKFDKWSLYICDPSLFYNNQESLRSFSSNMISVFKKWCKLSLHNKNREQTVNIILSQASISLWQRIFIILKYLNWVKNGDSFLIWVLSAIECMFLWNRFENNILKNRWMNYYIILCFIG